jgi:hypothetical protein
MAEIRNGSDSLAMACHAAQYFDPSAAPLTASDAAWTIGKAKEALSGVNASGEQADRAGLAVIERFHIAPGQQAGQQSLAASAPQDCALAGPGSSGGM